MKSILVFFLLCVSANAASHYIRASASGSNDGSSWANAWTTFGAVTWTRGDTYYVAGGTYNESPFVNVAASGTTRVTVKKANAADNSGDAGWNPSYATTVAQINGTFGLDKGYITVDGVTGSGTSGHGIVVYNAAFTDVIVLENYSGFELSHIEVRGAGSAASALAYVGVAWNNVAGEKKGLRIANCWIRETTTNGVVVLGAVGTSYSDYGLLFEDNSVTETGLCTDPDNHGQAMHLGLATNMRYVIIRNNLFRNNDGSAKLSWLGGSGTTHQDVRIYNNLFVTLSGLYTILSPGSIWSHSSNNSVNWLIANNSFYGLSASGANGNIDLQGTHSGILAKNNIWEACKFAGTNPGVDTSSNNGYFNNTGAVPSGTTNQVNGVETTFNNASLGDFSLKDGGYAVGVGLDLSSIFTTDITGATRTVPWDLGAYKSGSTPPPPSGGDAIVTGTTTVTTTLTLP